MCPACVSQKAVGRGVGFRLSAKRYFLTYPQTEISRKEVRKQLEDKLPIKEYMIAQEEHKEGGKHIHAVLGLEWRVDIKNEAYLHLEWEGKEVKGKYEVCRGFRVALRYLGKTDKNCETNMDLDENYRPKNLWKRVIQLTRENKGKEALALIEEKDPKAYFYNQGKLAGLVHRPVASPRRMLKEFKLGEKAVG